MSKPQYQDTNNLNTNSNKTSYTHLDPEDFHFGLEAEYLVCQANTFQPLWHQDLPFKKLHDTLASIPLETILRPHDLDCLELEAPHTHHMPYVVEGYGITNEQFEVIDGLPKGVEIRTPVRESIKECLTQFTELYQSLQKGLLTQNWAPSAISHHPIATTFSGPQNKRRYDFWQWAMEVMTTYGPDINVSLPASLQKKIELAELDAKINYYAPAMAALSLASPFREGQLWQKRGQIGKSLRTYKRSVIAPAIEIHQDEGFRLEFKVFEMSNSCDEFAAYFTLFLALVLNPNLSGRASKQSRIYDLGAVALQGLAAPTVSERLTEILKEAPQVLKHWGFDYEPLKLVEQRLSSGLTPADEMIQQFLQGKTLAQILKERGQLKLLG